MTKFGGVCPSVRLFGNVADNFLKKRFWNLVGDAKKRFFTMAEFCLNWHVHVDFGSRHLGVSHPPVDPQQVAIGRMFFIAKLNFLRRNRRVNDFKTRFFVKISKIRSIFLPKQFFRNLEFCYFSNLGFTIQNRQIG